ncbi:LysR family transcriptional regulator [Lysobacter sp. BMK333-48F3]|uniref:LysR family transcriptional regulator n=1 Tax=Lysobacter sp. BMK333-48F3 TaxID=2867962 RepID=UPI001C8CDDA6|nr:LysR substrate-binding domain-containing protein [Lysobacter sp. BMK333-48F3]MBX9400709.1 LysR family transcriptional regulator [Lysobacter sp. BMK333-48F3]
MAGFDLEQLKAFVAVADAGSISAGAARVFRSQSAVSEQLQKLERAAGAALLLRSRHGVAPTAAGQRLLGHARQLLALGELALHDVRRELRRTELRLGISDYYRPDDIAGLLRHLTRHCPQLRLQVALGTSAAIARGHAEGAYDAALVMQVDTAGTARASDGALPLRREPLAWVAAAGLDLRGEDQLPLVLLPPECALHRLAMERLRKHRSACRLAHQASGVAGLQAALRAGLGLGCLNASAIGDGLAVAHSPRLPALPDCSFRLILPSSGANAAVREAGAALHAYFA